MNVSSEHRGPATPPAEHKIDLVQRARQAMLEEGFEPDLLPDAAHQLAGLLTEAVDANGLTDLRGLLWSSIDNPDSRDLDQVEWAEALPDGATRLRVGIADVDSRVPLRSPLDAHAVRNTTSVYTGIVTFPMLPEEISTNLTSLNAGQDRAAMVIEMTVGADGTVSDSRVFRALLHNHAKLDYETIGPWLEAGEGAPPPGVVAAVPGLVEQLRLQDAAALRLAERRRSEGALELETVEARPVLSADRRSVVNLAVPPRNRAHRLIENLMVTANGIVADFLSGRGIPAIQRIVRSPERWGRIVSLAEGLGEWLPDAPDSAALAGFLRKRHEADPLRFPDLSLSIVKLLGPGEYDLVRPGEHGGHFGLAAPTYTHSTAPNRRYADLITQRLLKAALAEEPTPYEEGDLSALARHCTEREDAARKVERLMRKVAAAALLSNRIGETFDAVVTGATRKGTFVRLLSIPVEGRVVSGEAGLDVGDKARVRLISSDPALGFIDFERVH